MPDGLRSLYEQLVTVSEAERLVMENEGYLLLPDKPLPCDEVVLAAMKPQAPTEPPPVPRSPRDRGRRGSSARRRIAPKVPAPKPRRLNVPNFSV